MMLRIMGLWSNDNNYFSMLYTFLVVFVCVGSYILFQIINIFFIYDNLEALVGTVYILLIEIMAAIKVYYILKNSKILKNRIAVLGQKWINSNQKYLIEPEIQFWKRIYIALCSSCVACNAFLGVYPLVDRSTEERGLPFLSWYPYNYKISPYYEITYLHQIIGGTYLTFVHFNVDTTVAGFNVYTGCQLDMLCDNLRNFATAGASSFQTYKKLIDCIYKHKEILK